MATVIYYLIIIIAFILLFMNRNLLLYYFVFLYPILPEYLSISFSRALPLFTASRMLLLIMVLSLFFKRKVKLKIFRKKTFGIALLFFIVCETLVFLAHIGDGESVKAFVGILLENIIFLIVMVNLIDSKRKFEVCLKTLLMAAGFVFVMGILESITQYNLALTFLNTGMRDDYLISNYERFNSVRAAFTFGHALALAVYCVALLPFVMYKINTTKKAIYYILFELGLGCLLLTMSRSIILIYAVIFIISLVQLNKQTRKGYWKILGTTVVLGFVIVIAVPSLFAILRDTVLGTLNTLGAHFSVSSAGLNEEAMLSRFAQLTLISQVASDHLLFGIGNGSLKSAGLRVILSDRSFKARSIDIEYLSLFIRGGIVGLLGGVTLYLGLLKTIWRRKKRDKNPLVKAFFLSFICILLSYFAVAQLTTTNILWLLIAMYFSYDNLNKNVIAQ